MPDRSLLFFLLFFGCTLSLPAQTNYPAQHYYPTRYNYQVQRFTTENGLPSNGIKGLQWDEKTGFLWIASESGVIRYNGADFKIFTRTNNPDLVSERMFFMLRNREGRIYTVDEAGDIFFVLKNKLQFLYRARLDTRTSDFKLVGLAASGRLFRQSYDSLPPQFGFDFGLGQMIPLSETRMLLFTKDSLFDYALGQKTPAFITALEPDSRLFHLDGQLFIFSGRQQRFFRWDTATKRNIPVPITLAPLPPDDSQTPSATGSRAQSPAAPQQGSPSDARLFWDCGMEAPILIRGSLAWTIGYTGRQLVTTLISPAVPTDAMISYAQYAPGSGLLFLGTRSKGFMVIRKNKVRSVKMSVPSIDQPSSYYSQIGLPNGSILTDEGDILGGPPPPSPLLPIKKAHSNGKPFFNNYLYLDPDSTLWYSQDDSVYGYSYKTHRRLSLYDGRNSIVDGFIQSGGVLYAANAIGIGIIQNGKLTYIYRHPQADINGNVPFSMLELQPGLLALATCNGLLRFDTRTRRLDTLLNLPGICVRALWKYKDYLFIGTYGKGIYLMKNNVIRPIPLDKNKYLLYAHCFIPDKQGFCWISTNKGIFRTDPAEMTSAFDNGIGKVYYHYYGKNDGMDMTELNGGCTPCALMLNDSVLSFPSMDGLVWVNPAEPIPSQPGSDIFIDELYADDKKINIASLVPPELPEDTKDIKFHLGFPAWLNKENIYIEYKLVPYSKDWQLLEINGEAVIPFSNLNSGNYRLLVRKSNGFGEGNYHTAELSFNIRSQWYQQDWARLMAVFCLTLGFLAYQGVHTRRLKASERNLKRQVTTKTKELSLKNEELEKTDLIKTRLISIISHDLITPLKFLHLAGKSLIEKKNDLSEDLQQEAITEIMITSKELELLSTNILNWIKYKSEDNRLIKESFYLHELLEQLFRIFNSVARQKKIRLINEVAEDLEVYQFVEPVKIILYNLILNGINFTSKGHVLVSSVAGRDELAITVKDTGVGMTREQINNVMADHFIISSINVDNRKGNGLGYLIVKDLLVILKGRMSIRSEKGVGTQVTIRLTGGPQVHRPKAHH